MANRVVKIQQAYGVEVPVRLAQFYAKDQDPETSLVLEDGFVRGSFDVDFADDSLMSVSDLCENQGIDEMDSDAWAAEFAQYVPFGVLWDSEESEDEPPKSFLVVDITSADCPVLLWDYDGWNLYPIAATLDDFLAGRATGKPGDDKVKSPYKKFHWE